MDPLTDTLYGIIYIIKCKFEFASEPNYPPRQYNMWSSRIVAPLFITSALVGVEWSASRPGALPPGKELPNTVGQEAGWVPDQVWTLWSKEKSLGPAGKQTPAVQPVTVSILTELFQHLDCAYCYKIIVDNNNNRTSFYIQDLLISCLSFKSESQRTTRC
jgi:hypothetical protein